MIRSNLCDYADAYILLKETITMQEITIMQDRQMKEIRT